MKMLNRKSPMVISPRRWPSSPAACKDDVSSDGPTFTLPAVKVVESGSRAPKPPKKRFLEAAAAHQLLLQQQQQQQQLAEQFPNNRQTEDNSALMQLAEMCVVYQKNGQGNSYNRCYWSRATACKSVERKPVAAEAFSMAKSNASPKAGSPSWGWANGPIPNGEDENEEPLDLSGERTIRANQQDLIDHIVEKLCSGACRPTSSSDHSKSSAIQLMMTSVLDGRSALKEETGVPQSSDEVSSTIDVKEVKADHKDLRKDLPLKKRDPAAMNHVSRDVTCSAADCDSSTSTPSQSTALDLEPVTSSDLSKPAQRSCKGKRYLEFMYEGRIPLGSRVKRMELDPSDVSETSASGQHKKQRSRKAKRLNHSNLSLRGRKNRRLS